MAADEKQAVDFPQNYDAVYYDKTEPKGQRHLQALINDVLVTKYHETLKPGKLAQTAEQVRVGLAALNRSCKSADEVQRWAEEKTTDAMNVLADIDTPVPALRSQMTINLGNGVSIEVNNVEQAVAILHAYKK